MPYITRDGKLEDSRSPWRLSIISEFFWGIVSFVILFFQTMYDPQKTQHGPKYTSDYRKPGGGGGGGGGPPAPRRRMGGFGGQGGAPQAPPMGGGG